MNPHLRQRKIKSLMIVDEDGQLIEPDLDFYDAMLHLDGNYLDIDWNQKRKERFDLDLKRDLAKFEHSVELLVSRISRRGVSMPCARVAVLERCFQALGFVKDL